MVCRDPTPSDTPSHSDTDLAVPFADDLTEEDEEQDADRVFCTGRFSEATVEKTRNDVRNVSDGRTHFVLVWGKILFVRLVRDKLFFVLSLCPMYFYFFFVFCNFSLCFLCKLFISPN